MALSIENALEKLLDTLKATGHADKTLDLYRNTLTSLIKKCGYSMNDPCDQSTIDNLLQKVEENTLKEVLCLSFIDFQSAHADCFLKVERENQLT